MRFRCESGPSIRKEFVAGLCGRKLPSLANCDLRNRRRGSDLSNFAPNCASIHKATVDLGIRFAAAHPPARGEPLPYAGSTVAASDQGGESPGPARWGRKFRGAEAWV